MPCESRNGMVGTFQVSQYCIYMFILLSFCVGLRHVLY